jgi:LAO/AO transport system kinase
MEIDPDYYVAGVRSGNRKILAKTITLIESALAAHQALTATVMERLLPHTGGAIRLGITGVPGVGKSTFIECLGMYLISRGHRVAILAVDPSSVRSGGSIMGDKTRMEKLAIEENAFIRPSPSGGTLGGVSRKTRESMLACEAAGYDVIIVETVGVGQSEVSVASMVDFFLLLMLAGAGDELQGIKRGIVELADAIAVNKADGDNIDKAYAAKKTYENAIHLFAPSEWGWTPKVLTCSALETTGVDAVWAMVQEYHDTLSVTGALYRKRQQQALQWMAQLLEEGLKDWFYQTPQVRRLMPELTNAVAKGTTTPTTAVKKMLDAVNIN